MEEEAATLGQNTGVLSPGFMFVSVSNRRQFSSITVRLCLSVSVIPFYMTRIETDEGYEYILEVAESEPTP